MRFNKKTILHWLSNISSLQIVLISLFLVYIPQLCSVLFWQNHPASQWEYADVGLLPRVELSDGLLGHFQNDKPDLVIAYYDEDLAWVQQLAHLFGRLYIYHKHPDKKWPTNLAITDSNRVVLRYLPNVGRDNHSFLTHIIENYHQISSRTVFTVASAYMPGRFATLVHRLLNQPFCWKRYPQAKIAQYSFYGTPFFNQVPHSSRSTWSKIALAEHRPFSQWVKHHLDLDAHRLQEADICLWDGMFSIDAQAIRSYPISLYMRLRDSLAHASTTEDGYFMSFAWQLLFPQKAFKDRDSPHLMRHLHQFVER